MPHHFETKSIVALFASSRGSLHGPTIVELQEEQIKTAILFALIPVTVSFLFVVFILYRSKREAFFKQRQMEFKLSLAELELKALRAQIDPHFIFNCLNSIHHYMRSNDVPLAGEYLVRFAQLIRYVLETSSFRMIPLQEDLDALRAYLELEQLRLQRSFEFSIDVSSIENTEQIYIPPMMIQPFVENSIWHGLNQRDSDGLLEILIQINDGLLVCTIQDNGRLKQNRRTDGIPGIKKTSMGMSLIDERIKAVNNIFKSNAGFRIEDRSNDPFPAHGTRAILKLPFEQD